MPDAADALEAEILNLLRTNAGLAEVIASSRPIHQRVVEEVGRRFRAKTAYEVLVEGMSIRVEERAA